MPLKILYPYGNQHSELDNDKDINTKINSTKKAIEAHSYADLETLLQSNFIYMDWKPDFMEEDTGMRVWHANPAMATGGWEEPVFQYRQIGNLYQYSARPLLEAIYIDRPDEFYQLILTLVNSHNQELQDAFMRAWDKMSGQKGSDLPSQLFTWNDEAMDKAKEHLKAMNLYGKKLAQASVSKGDTIKTLSLDLQNDIEAFTLHRALQNKTTQLEFEVAKFKLGLINTLHRNDSELNEKRPNSGWKHAVMNVVSFLLTGNLAQDRKSVV